MTDKLGSFRRCNDCGAPVSGRVAKQDFRCADCFERSRPADDSGLLWYVHAWRAPDETETVSAIVLALTEQKAIAKFTREFPRAVVRCVTPQTDVIETPIN